MALLTAYKRHTKSFKEAHNRNLNPLLQPELMHFKRRQGSPLTVGAY